MVSDSRTLTAAADIDALAGWFQHMHRSPLPKGYQEYMTTLGTGSYCDLVRVYPPERAIAAFDEIRSYWSISYLWDSGHDVLRKEQVLWSIPVGNTFDGDEIILCPDTPDYLYVLPRYSRAIYIMPDGLLDPLNWRAKGKPMCTVPPFRYFQPHRHRAVVEMFTAIRTFSAAALAAEFVTRWSRKEVRQIQEAEVWLVFAKAIGGRIQLTYGRGTGNRIGIRIDYDVGSEAEVSAVVTDLTQRGFYETFRHKADS